MSDKVESLAYGAFGAIGVLLLLLIVFVIYGIGYSDAVAAGCK
jgi:hypothetical protein